MVPASVIDLQSPCFGMSFWGGFKLDAKRCEGEILLELLELVGGPCSSRRSWLRAGPPKMM